MFSVLVLGLVLKILEKEQIEAGSKVATNSSRIMILINRLLILKKSHSPILRSLLATLILYIYIIELQLNLCIYVYA